MCPVHLYQLCQPIPVAAKAMFNLAALHSAAQGRRLWSAVLARLQISYEGLHLRTWKLWVGLVKRLINYTILNCNHNQSSTPYNIISFMREQQYQRHLFGYCLDEFA
mmetsp:Transcript_34479/g.53560  ORF Transcript_34479/g.53560 Transcript_34479/m.53560 type:complete len:107 (-) Transcript_34479:41-361(-)